MGESSDSVDQRFPHPSPTEAPAATSAEQPLATALLAIVKEMGEQRKSLQAEHEQAAKERRAERRWRMAFQTLFFGSPVLLGILYFLFFLSSTGVQFGPFSDVVGVVRIDGEISAKKLASADRIIPALERAFASRHVKAVVLSIDSPGGAPVEAERIYSSIATLKKKYNKPVVSVINNLGASAAYMVAMHTDRIVAGNMSLVGSVGAVMAPWQLDKAMAKLDISQRVYASGKLKAFLNPFTPVSSEVDAKAKRLVDQMGGAFIRDLREARGSSLKQGVDFGTGEVWGGQEAKELGLVDSIGTLEVVVANTWGLKTHDFGPHEPSLGPISSAVSVALSSAMARVVETVAAPTMR